jgi:predicted NBD/HSP70 family sugar kinase
MIGERQPHSMKHEREGKTTGFSPPSFAPGPGPARPGQLRQVNASEVLRLLRLHTPCSCADLVRFSGLSAPTVSSTVEYLRRKGLVEQVGPGVSSGGRPPRLLRFNDTFGYVIGVDLGGTALRIALADLSGKFVGKSSVLLGKETNPKRVVAMILAQIRKLEREHQIPHKKLLAIAAGAPGITDTRSGVVLSAPNLCNWKNVPLRQMLEKRSRVPVSVENDVNLGALGESASGTARGVKNFVFLAIGSGIGAGIFVNGHLYHGSNWTAGEIGYLYVPGTEETPLAMDRRGPLESVIGGQGIQEMWRKKVTANGRDHQPVQPLRLRATQIFDLAESGNAKAREVLQHTARILADAITNVSLILNSSLVVLGGGVGNHPALLEATRQVLEHNEFARPQLALSRLGVDAQLHGAVWLALKMTEQRTLP